MNEKFAIEFKTGEEFLKVYNQRMGREFVIIQHGDSPDLHCRDNTSGELLALEVTLLEDLVGDIAYILGRGDRRGVRCFNQDTLQQFRQRITDKCMKDYGPSAALVLRQASILWSSDDWEMYKDNFQRLIPESCQQTFSKGVWVLTWEETPARSGKDIVQLA